MTEKTKKTPQEQIAFDSGGGSRGISYARENPYCAVTQADLRSAWEAGWEAMDRELSRDKPQ